MFYMIAWDFSTARIHRSGDSPSIQCMDEGDEGDDLNFLDTPNCPKCLESMEAVVGAWWCKSCHLSAVAG
jgi:hypothetical protein